MRKAVIDIGTNSVKLLAAEVSTVIADAAPSDPIAPLFETSVQTRLGRGLYSSGKLQPDAIELTLRAVESFAERAAEMRVDFLRVIATSAMREARNAEDLISTIRRQTGLKVEVLSGDQEAEYVFHGVASSPALKTESLLIMDIGGGSTEFILGESGRVVFQRSYPIGSVRLLESINPKDPPGKSDWLRCERAIRRFFHGEMKALGENRRLKDLQRNGAAMVGTGGSTTLLGRMILEIEDYDRKALDTLEIDLASIRKQRGRLWGMALEERKHIVGLPPERADVMLTGAALHEVFMREIGFSSIRGCTRGVRFGALLNENLQY